MNLVKIESGRGFNADHITSWEPWTDDRLFIEFDVAQGVEPMSLILSGEKAKGVLKYLEERAHDIKEK